MSLGPVWAGGEHVRVSGVWVPDSGMQWQKKIEQKISTVLLQYVVTINTERRWNEKRKANQFLAIWWNSFKNGRNRVESNKMTIFSNIFTPNSNVFVPSIICIYYMYIDHLWMEMCQLNLQNQSRKLSSVMSKTTKQKKMANVGRCSWTGGCRKVSWRPPWHISIENEKKHRCKQTLIKQYMTICQSWVWIYKCWVWIYKCSVLVSQESWDK